MNDNLTTELSRQLHDQVDGWHAAPLTLDGVRGKARSIRRTRRVAVASAAAVAVAAIAIPATLVGGIERTDPDLPPTTNSPTQAIDEPSGVGVPYLEGQVLTMPDGSTRELPEAYVGAEVLDGTVLGVRNNDQGFLVLDELDSAGSVVDSEVVDSRIAQNADGSAIAYVTDGRLVVRSADDRTELGGVGGATPVELRGGPDCDASVCEVYLNDGTGGSRVVTSTGEERPVVGDPLSIAGVAEDGRISMVTEVRELDLGSCGAVVDQRGERQFRSCDYTYGDFSPAGAHLAATQPYLDGLGQGWRAILNARTGKELARYESPSGGVLSSVWEDEDHLLITSWEDGKWKVTRLGADGSTEVVLGPTRGGLAKPPYVVLGDTF